MSQEEDYKAKFLNLIEEWRERYSYLTGGLKLTNTALASLLEVSRVHVQRLLNPEYPIDKKVMEDAQFRFKAWAVRQGALKEKLEQNDTESDESEENYLSKRRQSKQNVTPFMVPFVPVKAQAGYVKAVDQETYLNTLEQYALPPGIQPHGANWRYWEIEGNSMLPTFKSGDIILTSQVHPMDWDQLRNFYVYVIVTKDIDTGLEGVIIKRVYCKNSLEWVLISENEAEFPQRLLPVEYIREVWVYRKTIKTDASPPKKYDIKV
jgi:phage repressor protein C with HTH and peptisase S24 domain